MGDDNILMVKFAEEVMDQRSFDKYSEIAREGILVGLRRYHFFGESFFMRLMLNL